MRALHIPRPTRSAAPWPVRWSGNAPRVMGGPPSMTVSPTANLPKRWPVGSGSAFHHVSSFPIGGVYNFARGVPAASDISQYFVTEPSVTQDRSGTRATAGAMISFFHEGSALELMFHSTAEGFLLRIDDEYVGLDPIVASGTLNNFLFDFGSRALRRVDVIAYKASFLEAHTDPSDAVWAAPIRGPRAICMGDSFTTATPTSWSNWFADAMGWDDVWTSGVGGTGYLADANGSRIPFVERVEADIIAYRPEVVLIHGSVNDGYLDPRDVEAAVYQTVDTIRRHLPECIVAGGSNTPYGAEFVYPSSRDTIEATRAGFEAAGGVWLTPTELPLRFSGEQVGIRATLLDAVLAGKAGNSGSPAGVDSATGFRIDSDDADPGTKLRVGATVEIGSGETRERAVLTAQTSSGGKQVFGFAGDFKFDHAAGEPVREVAPSVITGTGNSVSPSGWGNADLYVGQDQYHPSTAGHMSIGQANAALLKQHLLARGFG